MPRYLLATRTSGESGGPKMSQEEMKKSWERIQQLEQAMKSAGAFILSARLTEPARAWVVGKSDGKVVSTDGPFAETKEQLAGFYIIEARDDDDAREWSSKVADCIDRPIEVRPFWEPPGA